MASSARTLSYKQKVNAPPTEVYRAFTNATALREWLCDIALTDPRKGGRFYVAWNDGEYASGEFTSLKPGAQVAFTWRSRGEPDPDQVQVSLKPQDGSTWLTLQHSGFASGKKSKTRLADYDRAWRLSLENLQSVLETGQDLRFVRRPLLGISGGEEIKPEVAQRLGLPVTAGVKLDGLMDGLGAQAAGLQSQDVIVKIGGRPIKGWETLIDALQQHHAGDEVKVGFYRGSEKREVMMKLSARPLPPVPTDPRELADELRRSYGQATSELEQAFTGVSEAEASARPSPDAWSAKDVLAHLIHGERDAQWWLTSLIDGQEPKAFPGNLTPRNRATVRAYPSVPDLLTELKRAQAETSAFIEELPFEFVQHKGSYWRIAYSWLQGSTHIREHMEQIRTALHNAAAQLAG